MKKKFLKPQMQPIVNSAFLYGRKPVLEIFRHEIGRIKKVYLQNKLNLDQELKNVLDGFREIEMCEEETLDNLTQLGRHQGIVVELKPKLELSLASLILRSKKQNGLLVVADQVKDPHNLGAIMRVAEAAGVDGLITTTDKSAPLTSATIRASAGAVEFLPIVYIKNLQMTLRNLKENGFWIVGLQKNDFSTDLYQTEIPTPTVVVLGSEERGLRQLTVQECDLLISIQMQGRIESLNVSQAASIFLYEILRRRR
ncbi:MAG: 23S rRNA (guanosine(2251)-2'-O)-methyltransferase RlmB [Deltaproteobacteria bacterium]|jgi:23S rRNA (guanosine2251-2'-O)-methyltransferase|nr:23S rRNA (guanosine(2251)-2'-O)-methyltransferase RlmB [Deltaproteobacteria bacterium]